ncbi:MAG: NAD(P)H-dependent oxidoreductase [Paracoccaceae bacterium]|nr:NAD(P)H-dependent oxidoreductase [Paracoccaceae bacterium]
MTETLLRIDASARIDGSVSRVLADTIADKLAPAKTIHRDLANGLPHIDTAWIGANGVQASERSAEQRAALTLSDTLVAELQEADTLLISLPIYNFGVPSTLKAWIDHVARAGITFRYSENGPVGLLEGKRAIIAIASGGTEVDSAIDFATPYLRHVMGFIGITDVEIVRSDRLMVDAAASQARAEDDIRRLAA